MCVPAMLLFVYQTATDVCVPATIEYLLSFVHRPGTRAGDQACYAKGKSVNDQCGINVTSLKDSSPSNESHIVSNLAARTQSRQEPDSL